MHDHHNDHLSRMCDDTTARWQRPESPRCFNGCVAHVFALSFQQKEPEVIVSDLHALNRFADTFSTNGNARTGILPYPLPPLPSRLAVEPSAMVSACANHGAEVAMSLEQPRGSAELLITAVEAQNHFKKSTDYLDTGFFHCFL